MYSFLLSLVLGLITYAGVAIGFDPIAGIVPAVMVVAISLAVILVRTRRKVDNEIQGIVPMLQNRQVAQAQQHLESIRTRYAKWMPLLDGQIDAQLGMIDYLQLKFDAALPLLENGKWRNWMALGCIGAIHFRKGRHDQAWEVLGKAIDAAPKEAMAYVLNAVLLDRAGKRDEALAVLNRGVDKLPDNKLLADLKNRVANKKKVKTKALGDAWYQFFPEDLAAQQGIAARRGSPMPGQGFRQPHVSKQMRRGR